MSDPEYFISCDWGTTNFRLRLVKTQNLEIVHEINSDRGIKNLYEKFQHQNSLTQEQFFSNYLKDQIQRLPEEHRQHEMVISGMASSNIGLKELPYAEMPIDQSGDSLYYKTLIIDELPAIKLISGVKSEDGVMRGEETQAIGISVKFDSYNDGILILPGTHSKHLQFRNGAFDAFKNYMTGELFYILCQYSILSNTINPTSWNKSAAKVFHDGLDLGLKSNLSESLFKIRSRFILGKATKDENYHFLSGLLIGEELSYLPNESKNIFLTAPDSLFVLYKTALEYLCPNQNLFLYDGRTLERALLEGQKKILLRNED